MKFQSYTPRVAYSVKRLATLEPDKRTETNMTKRETAMLIGPEIPSAQARFRLDSNG
jgi:hypothetical protein